MGISDAGATRIRSSRAILYRDLLGFVDCEILEDWMMKELIPEVIK
jgi:hypothetical protein